MFNQVAIVGASVQSSAGGKLLRTHPLRHDWTKEHGPLPIQEAGQ
jgi:hypothetical protein